MITRRIFNTIVLFLLIISAPLPRLNALEIHGQERPQTEVRTAVEAARTAGIPDASLNRILTLSVDYRISSQDLIFLLHLLRAAKIEKLPVEPLIAKVEEGLGKRVTPPVIAAALEQKIEDYRYVQSLVTARAPDNSNQLASEAHITVMADSLSKGLTRNDLAHFIKNAPTVPPSMLAVAVENLALLKQIGFEEELTQQILLTGLRARCFNSSWRYLARVIVAARNRGISDLEITEKTIRSIKNKSDLRDLMAALEFTGRDLRHGPAVGRGGVADR